MASTDRVRESHVPLEAALAIHERIGDRGGAASVRQKMATNLWYLGDLDAADARARDALRDLRSTGSATEIALTCDLLAGIALDLGDHDACASCAREALAIYEATGNLYRQATIRRTLATSRVDQGDLAHLDGFDPIDGVVGIQDVMRRVHLSIARCFAGDPDEAERVARAACEVAAQQPGRWTAVTSGGVHGILLALQGRIEEARPKLDAAREFLETTGDRSDGMVAVGEAFVDLAHGRVEAARSRARSLHASTDARQPPARRSVTTRLLGRILDAAIDRATAEATR
jgi:tetratricopeptide (TPR) repeat protein